MNQSVALSCLRVAKFGSHFSLLMSHRGGTVGSLALVEVNERTLVHDNAKQLGLTVIEMTMMVVVMMMVMVCGRTPLLP
jgi:hypothetical protein